MKIKLLLGTSILLLSGQVNAAIIDQSHELTRFQSGAGVGLFVAAETAQTVRTGTAKQLT